MPDLIDAPEAVEEAMAQRLWDAGLQPQAASETARRAVASGVGWQMVLLDPRRLRMGLRPEGGGRMSTKEAGGCLPC